MMDKFNTIIFWIYFDL